MTISRGQYFGNTEKEKTGTSRPFRIWISLLTFAFVLLAFQFAGQHPFAGPLAWAVALCASGAVFAFADIFLALLIAAIPPALAIGSVVALVMR
jgi:membrane associated rhomboid family serine protease